MLQFLELTTQHLVEMGQADVVTGHPVMMNVLDYV